MRKGLRHPTRYDRLVNYRLLPINNFFHDHVRQVRVLLDIPPEGISSLEIDGFSNNLYYYTLAAFALYPQDKAAQKEYRRELGYLSIILDDPHLVNLVYEDAEIEYEQCRKEFGDLLEPCEFIKSLAEKEKEYAVDSAWEGPSAEKLAHPPEELEELGWDGILLITDTPWLLPLTYLDTESWLLAKTEGNDVPTWLIEPMPGRSKEVKRDHAISTPLNHCTHALLRLFELPSGAFTIVRRHIVRGSRPLHNLETPPQLLTMGVKKVYTESGPELRATINGIDEFTTKREWLELWKTVQLHQASELKKDRYRNIYRRVLPTDDLQLNEVVRKTLLILRPGAKLERDMRWYDWMKKEGLSAQKIAKRWDSGKEYPRDYDTTTILKAVGSLEQRMKPKC